MLLTDPFSPCWLWRSRHIQTIGPLLSPAHIAHGQWRQAVHKVKTGDATLVVYSHVQESRTAERDDVLLVHGMEGSSDSGYIVRLANAGLRHGFHVHRMNLRGCGESLRLNRLPYHAGLWRDILAVARQVKVGRRLFVAGFSLGGNMVLKMAGDLGEQMRQDVAAIATISAALDMARTDLWLRRNRLYEQYLLWHLVHSYRRRLRFYPHVYRGLLSRLPRHIGDFDDAVTGPLHGFASGSDYYERSSSATGLAKISVPTLLIHAEDDPLVPLSPYAEQQQLFSRSSLLHLLLVKHGGHVGFMGDSKSWWWADARVIAFFKTVQLGVTCYKN
jgi:predicted alpha/beta-fold hydrolase